MAERHDSEGRRTETATGAPVRIDGLVKRFGAVTAVDHASLTIDAGTFMAILGPSGSGKTTVLMCIAGFEHPDDGNIFIGERPVTHLPTKRRNIGMVFQRYALFPHMTVADNIAFPLRMRRVRQAEIARRVGAALESVRLVGYERRMPNQLSGGQQQRVAFARALVYRPPVLLLDEPLSALDKKLREQMQIELKDLQRRLGVTVIFVTHDQQEALTMADRIAVMKEGRLEQVGRPDELYEQPATEFVAGFIGETNRLEGRLEQLQAGRGLAAINGTIRLPGHAAGTDGLGDGDPVALMVRPENVRLNGAAAPGPTAPGTVEKVIYSGATNAYVIRLDPETTITARLLTARGDGPALAPGDRVSVGWRAEDARLFRGADARP